MTKELKNQIERCTSKSQVMGVLKRHHLNVARDDSADLGAFSVWLDDLTRIYKPYRQRNMRVQMWRRETVKASGVPTFRPSLIGRKGVIGW